MLLNRKQLTISMEPDDFNTALLQIVVFVPTRKLLDGLGGVVAKARSEALDRSTSSLGM